MIINIINMLCGTCIFNESPLLEMLKILSCSRSTPVAAAAAEKLCDTQVPLSGVSSVARHTQTHTPTPRAAATWLGILYLYLLRDNFAF